MHQKLKKQNLKIFWALLLAVELIAAGVVMVDLGSYSFDDTYIYLSGARQLSRGELPNMTPGENPPTNSWASMVWTALLTPAFWLGLDALWIAKILGFLFLLGSIYLVSGLLRSFVPKLSRGKAVVLSGVLLLFAPAVYGAVNGLETALCLFTLLLSLRLLQRDLLRERLSIGLGLALGLHLLSRPDAFIEVLLIVAFLFWQVLSRKNPLKVKGLLRPALGALPGLLIFVGIGVIYGRLLPTSAGVKLPGLEHLISLYTIKISLLRILEEFIKTPGLLAVYAGAALGVIAGLRSRKDEDKRLKPLWWLIAALSLARLGEFALIGDPIGVHRLWLPAVVIATVATLVWLLKRLEDDTHRIGTVFLLGLALFGGYHGWRPYIQHHYNHPGSPAEQMGKLISRLKRDDSWLVTVDMGVVPYFADIPTIDAHGSPKCNAYRVEHPNDLKYIWQHPVDFVVLITHTPEFDHEYNFQGITDQIANSPGFYDNFNHLTTAQWAPDSQAVQGRGRYFHLWASERIIPAPAEVPIWLRKDIY